MVLLSQVSDCFEIYDGQNDEFMAKSGVVNYYSKWLGKHESEIKKPKKNPRK